MAGRKLSSNKSWREKYVGMTTMSGNSSKRLDVANVWWNMEEIELDYKGNSIKELELRT